MVYSSDFYTSRRPAYYKPASSYSVTSERHQEHGQPKPAAFTRNTVRVPWHKVPNVPRPSQVPLPYLVFGRRGDVNQLQREFLGAGNETDVEKETKELIKSALARRHLHETETIPSKGRLNHYRVDNEGHAGHTRRRILFSSMPPTLYRY
jgi:hypothetical protein